MNLSFMLKPFKAAVTSLSCLRPPCYTPVARRRRLEQVVSADQQHQEPEVDLDSIFSLAISLKYEGVEKIENLQRQVHGLEQEREKMMEFMYMASLDKAMQEILNKEAHIDFEAAEKKIETLESHKIDMQICLEGALQRAEDKDRQLEASAAQNAAAKQEYGQLLAEMETLRYEIESERRTMQISLESALQSVKEKEQELEAVSAENEAVVLQHVHLLTEMEVLSNQVEIKVSEKMEMEASLQSTLEMVQNKERELEALTAENFRLKEDNIRLTTFYDVERERMKKQEVQNANEIEALQTKFESCLAEKMDLERQVEELRFQLESMKPSDKQEAHELKQINGWEILKDGVQHAQDYLRGDSETIMFGSFCTSLSSWMENVSTTLTDAQKVDSPLGASVQGKERVWMVQSAGLVQAVKEEEMIESCEDGAAGENLIVQLNQLNKENGKPTRVDKKAKLQKSEHEKILHENGRWQRAEILKVAKLAADNEGRSRLLQKKSMQCSDVSKKLELEGVIADSTGDEKLNKELESKVQTAELLQVIKETGANKELESKIQSAELVEVAKETGANEKLESKVQNSGLVQVTKESEAIVHSCEGAVMGNMVLRLKEQDENLMMVELNRRHRAEILKNQEKVFHENGRRQRAEILKVVKLAAANEERRGLHQKSMQNVNERKTLEVAVVMADTTQVPTRNGSDEKQYADAEILLRKSMINNGGWRSRRSSEKWGMQVEGSNEQDGSRPDQSRYRHR